MNRCEAEFFAIQVEIDSYPDRQDLNVELAVAYEREFDDFASLLLLEKLGPRTLQSLVAEVIHGAPTRFSDLLGILLLSGERTDIPSQFPSKPTTKLFKSSDARYRMRRSATRIKSTDFVSWIASCRQ